MGQNRPSLASVQERGVGPIGCSLTRPKTPAPKSERDDKRPAPRLHHLETLRTPAQRKAVRALPLRSTLRPVPALQGGALLTDSHNRDHSPPHSTLVHCNITISEASISPHSREIWRIAYGGGAGAGMDSNIILRDCDCNSTFLPFALSMLS